MRALRLGVLAALILPIVACEFDERAVAPTEGKLIVHAVLNPYASEYKVLVEELLTGRVDVDPDVPFRDFDPIATGSGIPVEGATVIIYNAFGDSAVGIEDELETRSTGVYRFLNSTSTTQSAMQLVPGNTYQLKITTPSGDLVTGRTTIPNAIPGPTALPLTFNRDMDTLRLSWEPALAARTYLLRVNSPRGPYHMITDSQSIRLPGSLRDFFTEGLPSVFVPGFRQTLQVSAIDTNFYDYYRSQNNPFTGSGLINHLVGGTGLFGSLVPLETRAIITVANQDAPIEGEYTATVAFASNAPNRLSLYIESKRGSLAQITGNYDRQGTVEGGGVLGFQNGSNISLVFLREQLASDTLATYSGRLFGSDSIVGDFPPTGERIVYRKVSSSEAPRTRHD